MNTCPKLKRSIISQAVIAALGSTICSSVVLAQDIEEVLVWGTEVSSSTFQVDSNALGMKQADHVSDLLRTIPGVDVGGAHSLNQRITIRSMDDKDLRILIDGANQNTYMYHHMGNLQIHADILESVDIEVGNNSVSTGSLGGSVWFKTREAADLLQPDQQWGGIVKGGLSDNGSDSISVSAFGQLSEDADVLVYFNDVSRDNYEVGGGKILDENGQVIPGTDGKVRGLEGDLTDALIKFGYNLSDTSRIKIGYEAYEDKGDYSYRPDMGLATDLAIQGSLGGPLVWPTEFTRDTLTLNYETRWGNHTDLVAVLFRNQSELHRDESGWASVPGPFAAYAGQVSGEAVNTGFNLLASSELDIHSLTWGAEIINYDTDYQGDYVSGSESSSEEATSSALFVEDRIAFDSALTFIPGIRYSSYDIDSVVVDDTFSEISAALAIEYLVNERLLAALSTTQLFKGPEIGEVFVGAGLYDEPNPDIEAETGLNTELALAYDLDNVDLGLTLFNTEIDEYIYDYTAVGKDNVGEMSIEGFEAYVSGNWGNLDMLLSYSDAESELNANADYQEFEGARIDRQQGETLSLSADYAIPASNLTLHWDAMHVDDVAAGPDLDGPTLDNSKDGFTVHNLAVRWTPAGNLNGLQLTLGVDNVFDEFYASQSSRTGTSFHPRFGNLYLQDYEPGRNIKASASIQF